MAWAIIGVILVGLILLFVSRANHYKRIFAPEHYVEIAEGMANVKAAALQKVAQGAEPSPMTPEDGRVLLTRPGLAIAYTINDEAAGFVHHYSLSVPGNVMPSAVGTTFTIYLALLLNVSVERLTTAASEAGVYHTEFTLNAAEQSAFAARQIPVPSLDEAHGMHEQCQRLRESLSVGAVQTRM